MFFSQMIDFILETKIKGKMFKDQQELEETIGKLLKEYGISGEINKPFPYKTMDAVMELKTTLKPFDSGFGIYYIVENIEFKRKKGLNELY